MDIDIVISDHLRYLISAYHNTHSTFVKQKMKKEKKKNSWILLFTNKWL